MSNSIRMAAHFKEALLKGKEREREFSYSLIIPITREILRTTSPMGTESIDGRMGLSMRVNFREVKYRALEFWRSLKDRYIRETSDQARDMDREFYLLTMV